MRKPLIKIIIMIIVMTAILIGIFILNSRAADAKKKKWKKDTYVCTAYCPCYRCSGGYGGMTSTGKKATAGRTIAVDPRVIAYGTKVKINGNTYIAEDCGGAIKGKRIDIFFNSHSAALKFGRQTLKVKIRIRKKARKKHVKA